MTDMERILALDPETFDALIDTVVALAVGLADVGPLGPPPLTAPRT